MAEVVKPGQAQNTVTGSTSTSGSVGIGSLTNYTFADDSMSMSSSDNAKVVDLKDLRDLMSTVLDLPLDEINESFPSSSSTGFTKCPDVDRIEGIVGTVFTNNDDKFENLTFSNDSQLAPNQLVDRGHCKFNFTKIEVNNKGQYFSTINVNFIKTLKPRKGTYEYEKFTWNHIRLTIDCYSQNSDGSLEKCGNYQIIGNTGNKEQWWVLDEHTESSDLFTLTFPNGESDFNKTNPIVLSKESTEESIVTLQLTTQRRDIDAIQIKMDAYTSDLNPKYMYDADQIALGNWQYTYKMGMDKTNLYDCDLESYLLKDNIEVEHPENVYLTPSSPGRHTLNMYIGYEFLEHEIKENENIKLDIIVLQKFVGQPVFGNTFAQLEITITGGDDFKLMSMPERADNNDGKWYYVTENSTELPYGTHLDSSGIEFKNQNTELKNITFSQITNPNDLQSYDKIVLNADSYVLGDIDNVSIGFNANGQHPVLILKINEEFDSNGNLSIATPPVHTETYSYRIVIRNPYTIRGDFGPKAQLVYQINGNNPTIGDVFAGTEMFISTDTSHIDEPLKKEWESASFPIYIADISSPVLYYRLPAKSVEILNKIYDYPEIECVSVYGKINHMVDSEIYWSDRLTISIELDIYIGDKWANNTVTIIPVLTDEKGDRYYFTCYDNNGNKSQSIVIRVPNGSEYHDYRILSLYQMHLNTIYSLHFYQDDISEENEINYGWADEISSSTPTHITRHYTLSIDSSR